ncbi:Chaperone protein ClpC3, chloroplastic, partial [Frankliniella fusca]
MTMIIKSGSKSCSFRNSVGLKSGSEVTPFTRNLERGKVSPRRPLLTIVMTAPESITASQLTPLMVHFTMGLPGVGKSCGLREVSAAVLTTLDAATSNFP